ncbi:MAG: alanine racemase [Gemmatimonadetes bacterium]|nr:alanine racemase [Gemmatimonadota bacterium]
MTRQPPNTARAWVDVDLAAVRRNAERLRAHCRTRVMPIVKADAYGLGAVPVARALEPLDPWGFGVATVSEGIALRDGGVTRPILVCPPVLRDEFPAAAEARLTLALGHAPDVAAWRAAGGGAWHLSVDTGMTRAGVRWDDVAAIVDAAREAPPEGAFTHFLAAERGDASMAVQEERFRLALAALANPPALLHAENSAAAARRPNSRYGLVRPGLFLWGVWSGPGALVTPDPVAAVRARVTDVHRVTAHESVSYDATWVAHGPRRIATVSLGYADGYRRAFGNRGHMLVNGRRAPVVGVVTMDMTMLDVTDVPCEVGDAATALGADGGEAITAEELATLAECSPYELLCGLRMRLARRYLDGAAVSAGTVS